MSRIRVINDDICIFSKIYEDFFFGIKNLYIMCLEINLFSLKLFFIDM